MSPILVLGLLVLLLLVVGAPRRKSHARPRADGSVIHRCDFCKEAILLIDEDARTFVQHAGPRPLLGYSVVNACGACVREYRLDGVFTSERADPSA